MRPSELIAVRVGSVNLHARLEPRRRRRPRAREDGEDPDAELRKEDIISPWYIRKRLGLSQRHFTDLLAIPVATLQDWEQNRVIMEPATRALMRILAHEPKAALRALRRRAA